MNAATARRTTTTKARSAKASAPTHLSAELAGKELGSKVVDTTSAALDTVVDAAKTVRAFASGFWHGLTK